MIKIKLYEAKTLPVPEQVVEQLVPIYRAAFIKLAVEYVNKKISNTKLKPTIIDRYIELLEIIKEKYPKDYSRSQSPDSFKEVNLATAIKNPTRVYSFPVEYLINAVVAWEGLDTYLRDKIEPGQFKRRLMRYFKKREVEDIQLNIELIKREINREKNYAGLYDPELDIITVTFNSSFFEETPTENKDSEGNIIISPPGLSADAFRPEAIVNNIETELSDTRTSVRHELQHMFQNLISLGLGIGGGKDTKSWLVGLPPSRVIKGTKPSGTGEIPHYMSPTEMQTDIQDEVDAFEDSIKTFKQKNESNSQIFPQAVKILAKIFAHSDLSSEESKFAKKYNLNSYIFPNELFGKIKSSTKSGELYKYALRILYSSIGDQIRESFVMDKIKIILTENNNIISENLTKDEVRKIIRDELEKLIGDKEIKKQIGEITKKFMKKFYRELSIDSTYVIDRIDI